MTASGLTIRRTSDQRGQKRRSVVPEQPVTGIQGWPMSLALEDRDLLAESQDFQCRIGSRAEESPHGRQEGDQELQHELTVVTWRNAMVRPATGCPPKPFDFMI